MSTNLIQGYYRIHTNGHINWRRRLDWLENTDRHLEEAEDVLQVFLTQHQTAARQLQFSIAGWREHQQYRHLAERVKTMRDINAHHLTNLKPSQVINAVIIATYNESYDILESSVEAVLACDYPLKNIVFIVAYEERGGEQTKRGAHQLIEQFGHMFKHAEAVMHPDGIPGEVRGKGGNITYAGRRLAHYIDSQGIDPENVIVTTLDADNRPAKQYFANLAYIYALDPNRVHRAYQPIAMFNNNIWDAPAPMRVIAMGNSFWNIIETMRPYRLRNFSSHAQGLKSLLSTDFWSVTSPVEDGHQYWRSYFAFDGDYRVTPVFVPIYQDAVLDRTYLRTIRAQFIQLRRWAYGVSDFPYAVREAIRNTRAPFFDKVLQIMRLFEGHFSWATSALLITFVAWLPLYLNHQFSELVVAHQLPLIASRMMNVALLGQIATVTIALLSLPPRPANYKPHRSVFMVLQWVLLPITSIAFGAFAALNAQTRLMFGRYLGFDVTNKSRRRVVT